VHTYFVPGTYLVKLTVHNIAGESVRNGVITVYQNPSAIFDAYPTHVVNNEQIVIFYSYSYFANHGYGGLVTGRPPPRRIRITNMNHPDHILSHWWSPLMKGALILRPWTHLWWLSGRPAQLSTRMPLNGTAQAHRRRMD
jgi:hypothetical protein